MSEHFELIVIGGGIVGLSTARALCRSGHRSIAVIEAEDSVASHQSGRNSGVIHAGLYYKPGSLKARLCTEGREALYRYCEEKGVEHRRCGKLIVAVEEEEIPRLEELERCGRENGLEGLTLLEADRLRDVEPRSAGVAGLWVPQTGVVDFAAVARALVRDVESMGGTVRTAARVVGAARSSSGRIVATSRGKFHCRQLVNCAGLQSDRIARLCGLEPEVRIVPFRGEYFALVPEKKELVRGLLYPVPDPELPFLGVHVTRTIDDRVLAGPNAVAALSREGYRWSDVSVRDLAETLAFRGTWRLAGRLGATGLRELGRSFSRRAFVRSLRRLLPEVSGEDLVRAPSGVRAQAVDRDGQLLSDFRFLLHEGDVHVLNAPSPAATAALAIGRRIARLALEGPDREAVGIA
jgi:L-2-hydroxyglutarate oxidase